MQRLLCFEQMSHYIIILTKASAAIWCQSQLGIWARARMAADCISALV